MTGTLYLQRFNNRYFVKMATRAFRLPVVIGFAGMRIAGDPQHLLEDKLIGLRHSYALPPGISIQLLYTALDIDAIDEKTHR
ncbi:hypothetical protein [Chitinophaga filiformis]|uniref:Uncharacterized protein n=1 Tax=Chitinophaga filiformis TaxID=104663 RepID=A0ABY4HY01_CHIFI|nr:hypothetical protein [Chitinophaga filiformis]UPK68019.1 hypothetical protein MYF79_23995 [Chitinophaga filiformis]